MMTTSPLITSEHPKGIDATARWRAIYNKAGLTDETGQQLNEDKEFPDELLALIKKCSTAPFGPEELVFDFMVPKSSEKKFTPYFEYGKKYEASFFQIQRSMSSKSCIEFLKSRKSIFAGEIGFLFLKTMNLSYNLPKGLVIFFGEDDKSVPYVQKKIDGMDKSNGAFELAWPVGSYLISFREVQ